MPYSIGYSIVGPIFGPFVTWAIQQAVRNKIDRIGFVARDGFILHKMAMLIANHIGYPDLHMRYLYGSRQSWRLAAMTEFTSADVDWILRSQKQLTGCKIAVRLGLSQQEFAAVLRDRGIQGINFEQPLSASNIQSILKMLSHPNQREATLANAARQRGLLVEYLKQEKLLTKDRRFAMVDLGWNGTMQDALQSAFNSETERCNVQGYYFGLRNPLSENKHSFCASTTKPLLPPSVFGWSAVFFESLLTACHGSTTRYARNPSGCVAPVLDDLGEAIRLWGYSDLAQGACQFVKEHLDLVADESNAITSMRHARDFLAYIRSYRVCDEFAETFGLFPFNPDHDSSDTCELAPKRSAGDAVRYCFAPVRKRNEITMWPRGTGQRSGGVSRYLFSPSAQCVGMFLSPRRIIECLPYSTVTRIRDFIPSPVRRIIERTLFGQ